jgi:glycosyltransferase involved in cell wall biosynthesis
MLKVLFLTRKWPPAVGGMETYSVALTENLRRFTELHVWALPGDKNGQPPSMRRLSSFVCASAWRLLRSAGDFDVIHLGDLVLWPLGLAARCSNRRSKLFVSAHGSDIALPLRRGLGPRCYELFLRIGALLSGQVNVIANSQATAMLCRAAGFRVTAVVPLGVQVSSPAAGPVAPSSYVLFVGRLLRSKGCRWFIENVLPRLDPELRLVVAGVQWDRSEFDALGHERVEFRGAVYGEELRQLRRAAVAVVVPNITCAGEAFEGFGLAAVETAADEGVLLASRLHGIVDAVIDGVTGFLLPPEDADAWVAKIGEVADWTPQSRRTFLQHAREHVLTHFSWDRVAHQTLEAYGVSANTQLQANISA